MTKEQIESAIVTFAEMLSADEGETTTPQQVWEEFQVYDLGEMLIVVALGGGDDPWTFQDGHWSQLAELNRGSL